MAVIGQVVNGKPQFEISTCLGQLCFTCTQAMAQTGEGDTIKTIDIDPSTVWPVGKEQAGFLKTLADGCDEVAQTVLIYPKPGARSLIVNTFAVLIGAAITIFDHAARKYAGATI